MSTTIDVLLNWQPKDSARTYERRAGHWWVRVTRDGYRAIYHYTTWMMGVKPDGTIDHTSVGYGSVSDQRMMNRLFHALGSDLYYSRKGGASIGLKDEVK